MIQEKDPPTLCLCAQVLPIRQVLWQAVFVYQVSPVLLDGQFNGPVMQVLVKLSPDLPQLTTHYQKGDDNKNNLDPGCAGLNPLGAGLVPGDPELEPALGHLFMPCCAVFTHWRAPQRLVTDHGYG